MRRTIAAHLGFGALVACGGGDGRADGDEVGGISIGTGGITVTASASATDGVDGVDGSGGGTGPHFDVGSGLDIPGSPGDCNGGMGMMGGDVEFSFIWIANSPAGTVSKIDTRTGVEVARYATGPAEQAEPSRTSVNLYGDVAVSNRGSMAGGIGGTTKIAARVEDCVDKNGNGMIETSNGPANVLPWGSDECVIWNLAIPSDVYQHGPRPTAWEGKVQNGCAAPDPRLWMGWYDYAANTGRFHRVDGSTGMILDTVDVPGWNGLDYGPYGGAVNKDGDFFVVGWQMGPLVRIDGETLQVDRWAFPTPPQDQSWSYGMALDQYGNPWIASAGAAANFDVASQTWNFVHTGNQSMRGVMVDKEDRAWYAVDASSTFGCGVGLVDVTTKTVLAPAITLPGCSVPVGISIDVDGYVWVVDQGANAAFKVDPETYQVELVVSGLTAPYTYSDMTGAGLDLVVNPPAG